MKRIPVEDIRRAYEVTGMRPVQKVDCGNGRPGHGYFNFRNSTTEPPKCGCAFGALFLEQNTQKHYGEVDVSFWAQKNFDREYRWGFAEAFDGEEKSERYTTNPLYEQGYSDGKAAAAAAIFGDTP